MSATYMGTFKSSNPEKQHQILELEEPEEIISEV